MGESPSRGATPSAGPRWVRPVAVALTCAVLLWEAYAWVSWHVTREILRDFQESLQEQPAPRTTNGEPDGG